MERNNMLLLLARGHAAIPTQRARTHHIINSDYDIRQGCLKRVAENDEKE